VFSWTWKGKLVSALGFAWSIWLALKFAVAVCLPLLGIQFAFAISIQAVSIPRRPSKVPNGSQHPLMGRLVHGKKRIVK
jgi:hypothetical protein